LGPHLAESGYELVEIEVGQHGGRGLLRVYVDRAGGVTIDDCVAVSQLLGPILDAKDIIDGSYTLEVSSPGFERPVRKAEDFERFAGETIAVKTNMAVNGRRKFKGTLKGIAEGDVAVECDGIVHRIALTNVLKANLVR
jgi:ribosome maturation factor RimP